MHVKILRNTQGAKCWYDGRIGEVFACQEYDHLGMQTGDFEAVDPACGKRALIAAEDGEVQPEKLKNVWVHPDDVADMRDHAAKLARRRAKLARQQAG